MKLLSMAVGGALGTLLRYGLSGAVYRFAGSTFPWGTLSVNLLGSLVIGILFALFEAAVVSNNLRAFAMVGVLGGFTTFSTFSLETFNLLRDGELKLALGNVLLSTVAGVILVFAGYAAAKAIVGK